MRSLRWCNLFLVIPILIFLLSSCSNGLHIEKRHYRSGFYIDRNNQNSATTEAPIYHSLQPEEETDPIPENPMTQTEVQEYKVQQEAEKSSRDTNTLIQKKDALAPPDTTEKNGKFIDRFKYKGPPEAKKAMTIHRLGLTFILVSIAGILLSLTPLYFFGYGAVLMLPGIVLEIIAIVFASEGIGTFSTTNSEKSEYFRKIRRRAIWGLAILGIGYVIFIAAILFMMLFLNGY